MSVAAVDLTSFAPLSCLTRGRVDADFARRAMRRRDMIAVTTKVFRRGFPVGVQQPTVRPADFGAAFTSIKENIEIPSHVAQIVFQRGRLRIEGRKDQSLVAVNLRDRDQAPLLAFQAAKRVDHRHQRELAVVGISPTVIRTGKQFSVAAIGTADAIAAMPAKIQVRPQLAV